MSEENVIKEQPACDEDKELAELLDSALEDFTKETPAEKVNETKDSVEEPQLDTEWTDEFIRQVTEQFESNISNILREAGGPELSTDQVQQSFQRMAEAAAQTVSNSGEAVNDTDFGTTISQALRGLTEGTENLQNPFSEQDLMNMFGQQGGGPQNALMPFLQGMMQNLLSKEVLYPSLQDILTKYPAWMEANGGSLSVEERRKYEKQQELLAQVCEQLQKEAECDTPDKMKAQFDTVLELMQKLQDCGQPPIELVGDLGPGIPFNSQGVADFNQCNIV